jgi:class 3 adenylate cyclase
VLICTKCGHENGDFARFCGDCAAPLGAVASGEQRKTVTVLFCDVTGSTELGEALDPEALRTLLAPSCTRTTRCGPSAARSR